MSSKEENPSLTGYYSMEKFIKELKKISGVPDTLELDDYQTSMPLHTSGDVNNAYFSPYYKNRAEQKSKIKVNNINPEIDPNETMKQEMTKLRKENAELKFCLNNVNKKFDNELKEIKTNNELKEKELKETKEILKKNAALIELLGDKISNYEKTIETLKEEQNLNEEQELKNGDDKYKNLIESNKKLKEELTIKENMINSIKNELNTKNQIYEEINRMKSEMENYLQTMDKLYGEIESRDGIIKQLKDDIQVIEQKYQNEINDLKNKKSLNDLNNIKGDEKLISELKASKEKEIKLNKELSELQQNYNEMKTSNDKMKELAKESNGMIKSAIDSRDKLKNEYEKTIKELIEKYEKQIKFMKTVLAKQSEEFEEKIKTIEKEGGQKNKKLEKNEDDGEQPDAKMEEMMKVIKDNKELLKQNEELKNLNEVILSKMKELPNLEQKYTDLFDTVKLLQEENNLLKEASKYSSMIELSQSKIKEIPSDTNVNNTNTNIFEDTPKTKPQINKKENNNKININNNKTKGKNLLLDDEDSEEGENNKEKQDIPVIKQKEIVFDKNKNINSPELINNNDSNSQIKIYNKKKLPRQTSPKLSKDNLESINNKSNNNIQKESDEEKDKEIDTKEEENNNQTENNDLINQNFNLYKPIKEGLLTFNLAKKNYYTIVPEEYSEFWKSFDPETSIQYNTLEGLFLVNSKQNNQLYYYSSKKNTFSPLFQFTEDHSYGCLFLDNLSKNIIAIGGKNSKLVEKFSFEEGTMEQLPPLSTHRSKMTCCQVGEKIYCFLGLSEERPNESIIEFLDLNNLSKGWTEVEYENQTSFNILTGMSCVNLNDNELFIIGGLVNDESPNEKLLYFTTEQNELFELNKDLPDSDDKNYLFTKNTMFNVFLNGNIISYTNIDDHNQVHILDNELKYDLYLTPKP